MARGKRHTANEISDEALACIRADIARWRPGLFAAEVAPKHACICGLARPGAPPKHCYRHGRRDEPDAQA